MLAAIVNVTHLVETAGYPLLFVIVMSESSGIPVPGETALITAAVLASQGKLQIELVIPLAAAGAIVGDNIGYLIGRKGGRWVLERPGAIRRQRQEVLRIGEPFFERHGPKAVYFGRFLLGLRVWASWLAGATRMHWRSFVIWNALGGISWATLVGVVAYLLGHSAGNAIETFGLYGLAALVLAVVSTLILHRRHRRRTSVGEGPPIEDRPASGAGPPIEDPPATHRSVGDDPVEIGQQAGEAADPAAPHPLGTPDASDE
jgi:membrane protein DedA with SNARE-associated domain